MLSFTGAANYSDIAATFVKAGALTDVQVVKHEKNSDAFFSRSDNATFADAGALSDPGVRGVEPRGQLVIGHDPLGQVPTATDDLGTEHHTGAVTMPRSAAAAASEPPD